MNYLTYLITIIAVTNQSLFTLFLIPLTILIIFGGILKPGVNGTRTRFVTSINHSKKDIAIILPFYRENKKSIKTTVGSLIEQDHPKDKMHLYILVEKKDNYTLNNLEETIKLLEETNIDYKLFLLESGIYGKADALNSIYNNIIEDYIIIFDADNQIPKTYLSSVVNELNSGADAVTTRVYRYGEGLHAKLLLIDTVFWYDVILPSLTRFSNYIPLSGEGMAIKKQVLEKIGGFPKVLTEDALVGVKLAEINTKVIYLSYEHIIEKAPKNFYAQIRQRLRWFQGYLEILPYFIKKIGKIGIRKSFPLGISLLSPITAMATLVSDLVFGLYWIAFLNNNNFIMTTIQRAYPTPIFYWGLSILTIGFLQILFTLLYVLADSKYSRYAPIVFLMPIYWIVNGIIGFLALILPRRWRKTMR